MKISNNLLAFLVMIFILMSLTNSVINIKKEVFTGKATSSGSGWLNILPLYPSIENLVATAINDSANITWTNPGETNSSVSYGIGSVNLSSSISNASYISSHHIPLTNLSNFTVYWYNVTSCYTWGRCNTTGPYYFVTSQNPGPPTEVPGAVTTVTTRGGGVTVKEYPACIERWECTPWYECLSDGTQIRECLDFNNCGTTIGKPIERRTCAYKPLVFRIPGINIEEIAGKLGRGLWPWLFAILALLVIGLFIISLIALRRREGEEESVKKQKKVKPKPKRRKKTKKPEKERRKAWTSLK